MMMLASTWAFHVMQICVNIIDWTCICLWVILLFFSLCTLVVLLADQKCHLRIVRETAQFISSCLMINFFVFKWTPIFSESRPSNAIPWSSKEACQCHHQAEGSHFGLLWTNHLQQRPHSIRYVVYGTCHEECIAAEVPTHTWEGDIEGENSRALNQFSIYNTLNCSLR